jgi:hypothetical protein
MRRADVEVLVTIQKDHGAVTPRLVRDAARNPDHPWHADSRWLWHDDRVAAEKYRLDVAREKIREVRIEFVAPSGEANRVRAYMAVPAANANEWEYELTADILADKVKRQVILGEMQRRIDELLQTYRGLEEFWEYLRKVARRKAS